MSGEEQSLPWVLGNLVCSAQVVQEVEAHAVESYPSECCGFISGPAGEPSRLDTVIREVNEADRYHALDPERFPRTSHTYFKINELRAHRAFEQGDKAGRPIKVIYHSHCDAGSYFSAEDAATFASEDGHLMWPCAFLVVSIEDRKVAGRQLWVHVPGTDGFIESTLEIE